MNKLSKLRHRAIVLQEYEIQLQHTANAMWEGDPNRMRFATMTLGRELQRVIQTSNELHQQISTLLQGKELEKVSDASCLKQIIFCQRKLVELHSNALKKIRRMLVAKTGEN